MGSGADGDVVAAEIRNVELIEIGAAEGTVGRLAEQQVFWVLTEEFDFAIRRDAIDAVGRVGGDVQIAAGVKGQAIGDTGHAFDKNLRGSRCSVRFDFNS